MKKLLKIASVAMAAVMLLSAVPFTASAATKKAVSTSNLAKGVKISWKKTDKAGKYKVYRSTSKNKGFTVIGTTKKVTFTDKKAKAGKTYYYTVKTTNKTNASYKTSKVVRLTAPTLKSVVALESGNRVKLKWTKVNGAKSYGIYYATVKNGKTRKYQELYTVNKTKETIVLNKAGTYNFKIVAKNGTSKSVFSNIKKLNFVKTPDIVLEVGKTSNEVAEGVKFVKDLYEALDIKINFTFKVENPEIVSIDENYVITGLADGDTKISMTVSAVVDGEKVSETTKIWVRVKKASITEDQAIELVKEKFSGEYAYIPGDKLVTLNGKKYYEIAVKRLLDTGNYTTIAIYYVRVDASEVFDKYANTSYVGEYVRTGVTADVTFKVFENGTFEMIATGDVNQVVSGAYKFGITNDESVIKLILIPKKSVTEIDGETTEETITGREGTAIIENGILTLSMESQDTIFTKK